MTDKCHNCGMHDGEHIPNCLYAPDDIPKPEAVREYESAWRHINLPHPTTGNYVEMVEANPADAAVAELVRKLAASVEWGRIEQKRKEQAEAERDALRCCGNCGNYSVLDGLGWHGDPEAEGVAADHGDGCHFTPPRWRPHEGGKE